MEVLHGTARAAEGDAETDLVYGSSRCPPNVTRYTFRAALP
jgi:hypothetical protein